VRKTAVLNQKGGVGKTAISVGVAGALAELGKRVLLVDLDPQGHATTEALGLAEAQGDVQLAKALHGAYRGPALELAVRHSTTDTGGVLDVWCNSQEMFLVEHELQLLRVAREGQLTRLLKEVDGDYDHAVIDCPPALNGLTDNALTAAEGLLIPLTLDPSMLRAMNLLLNQTDSLDKQLQRNPIHIHGLVPGLFRRPLSKLADAVDGDLKALGLPMLGPLPLSVAVPEAWKAGVPMTQHAPDHEHTTALRAIATVLEEYHP
jgi:chromosome partitioning protein